MGGGEGAQGGPPPLGAGVGLRYPFLFHPYAILPAKPWEETRQEYASRLKACCDEINCNLDVEALCRAFPRRIQNLVNKQGGRLKV